MSSPVIAVRDYDHLIQVARHASEQGKLLVLEFMGSVSYRSTCEYMKPIFESIAANYKKNNVKAEFCTVDVNNNEFKELAENFGVQALPTFWMILDFRGYECSIGTDKEELTKIINKHAPKK